MKNFKFLFLIVLAVICSVGFVACGDDDEPETNKLVGKWECLYDAYGDPWDEPLYFVFNDDGTGSEWFFDDPSDRLEFTYVVTSSAINVKTEYGDVYKVEYKFSSKGNKLTLYGWDDDDMYELIFERV